MTASSRLLNLSPSDEGLKMYDEYSAFGRLAHPALSPILAAFGGFSRLTVVVTEEFEHGLELVWETLAISTPIAIPLQSPARNSFDLTDVACNGDVLMSLLGFHPFSQFCWQEVFRIVVQDLLAPSWRDTGNEHWYF